VSRASAMLSLAEFISRFQLQVLPARPHSNHTRQAAVLIPVICRPEPTLLLTRRAKTRHTHPDQIAFPGGAADCADGSLIATALREAQEEVAVPPQSVTIPGQLAPSDSFSGYQVTPVTGLVPSGIWQYSLHVFSCR
jgi:8-oxo-dGTP pyrophosphatase MutT (NUDIX family)